MVNLISAALPVAFATLAAARVCHDLTVEVTISARNGVFNISAPKTNVDVTNIMLGLSRQGSNFSAEHLTGYATVGGTYELASTYCRPDSGAGKVLQILTHGIGFDRSYWDFPANKYNYSYVAPAVDDYGYSTFSWDRLGIAESSHGEPINEIQAWLEVAALKALTDKLRAGTVPGVGCTFEKIVHVGHSFGSVHSYALTAAFPDISDGIVLTGFAPNSTFISNFILGNAFIQANKAAVFRDYPNGYLAPAYEGGVQVGFFAQGNFDPKILTAATKAGQPVTVGELLTIGGEANQLSSFAKPVLIITGERDLPFCGGDCLATGIPQLPSLPAAGAQILPKAAPFEAIVVPDAGHGLTLSYSHLEVTGRIQDFLAQNGLDAENRQGAPASLRDILDGKTDAAEEPGPPPSTTPIPIVLCGKAERIGRGVIEGLKPEYEVVHFITTAPSGAAIIPALLTGQAPPSHPETSSIGSGNYTVVPRAVVLGSAFDDAAVEVLRGAVANAQGARKVPWLRHDLSKPSPPIGPEYGKVVLARAKEALGKLEREGKLDGEHGDDEWY
ncbi:hypothetical protein EsH8_II_000264 [Colletotrichum jinshuiense]